LKIHVTPVVYLLYRVQTHCQIKDGVEFEIITVRILGRRDSKRIDFLEVREYVIHVSLDLVY